MKNKTELITFREPLKRLVTRNYFVLQNEITVSSSKYLILPMLIKGTGTRIKNQHIGIDQSNIARLARDIAFDIKVYDNQTKPGLNLRLNIKNASSVFNRDSEEPEPLVMETIDNQF